MKTNWAICAQIKDVWWWSEHEFLIRVYLAVSHSAPLWARCVIQQPHRCYLLICGTGVVSTSARRTMNTHTEELLKWTSSPHFRDHISILEWVYMIMIKANKTNSSYTGSCSRNTSFKLSSDLLVLANRRSEQQAAECSVLTATAVANS